MTKITILSSEIFADLRSAGWLESEINPDSNLHRRHEAADICERDNIDRIWRILGTGVALVRLTLRTMTIHVPATDCQNELLRPEKWEFFFRHLLSAATIEFIKEKIHEYLVASVLAERLKVLIPSAASAWIDSEKKALADLDTVAATYGINHPVRRPLCPL